MQVEATPADESLFSHLSEFIYSTFLIEFLIPYL